MSLQKHISKKQREAIYKDFSNFVDKCKVNQVLSLDDNITLECVEEKNLTEYDEFGDTYSGNVYKIFHWIEEDKYFRLYGWVSSYGDDSWDSFTKLVEVKKVEKVITTTYWREV